LLEKVRGETVQRRNFSVGAPAMSSPKRWIRCFSGLLLSLCFAFVVKKDSASFIGSRPSTLPSEAPRDASPHVLEEAKALQKQSSELYSQVSLLERELKQQQFVRQKQHRLEIFHEFCIEDERNGGVKGVGSASLAKFLGNGVSSREGASLLELYGYGKDGLLSFEDFEPERLRQALEYVRSGDGVIKHKMKLAEERLESERNLLASLPAPNADARIETRCLAVLPYLIPLVSAICVAAPWHPTAFTFAPWPLLSAWLSWHWVIALMMTRVANQRKLPLILRFNIQQAFTVNLLLMITASLSSWIYGEAQCPEVHMLSRVMYRTPEATPIEGVLLLTLGCLAYSVVVTLLGRLPDGIFFVSEQARHSLGRMRPVNHDEV